MIHWVNGNLIICGSYYDKKVYGYYVYFLELCALKRFFFVNIEDFAYLSSKKKNLPLLYSHVTYLYLINYTYSP